MNRLFRHFRSSTVTIGDAIIPKKIRTSVQNYLRRADVQTVNYFAYGLAVYILIILSFILVGTLLFVSPFFINISTGIRFFLIIPFVPIIFIVLFSLTLFFYKVYIDLRIRIKINQMEDKFPEFLSVLALNLRTGSTFDVALENSTDKEFGVLSEEIKLVVRRTKLGGGVEEAINEFRLKYKSDLINDTFQLLLLSWKKGGNTAALADRLYDNMKSDKFLNEKIVASVTNYKIFLNVLALGITPAMFALTYHLIELIKRITGELANVPNSTAMPFTINAIRINESHFVIFSVLAVLLVSVCIGIIINVVKTGSAKNAYKQLVIYAVLSYISYQIFMQIFSIFFSLFAV
jgi:archaellum biogenesis protein FlaJ (TadC family)